MELELTSRPSEAVTVFANCTWLDAQLEDGAFDGNEVPGVATYSGSAGATVAMTPDLTFDVRGRWVHDNKMIGDFANSGENWRGQDYVVFDAKVSYTVEPFTFYAGVNNIADEEYAEYAVLNWAGVNLYPSPERNFVAGVKFVKPF